MVRQTHPPQFFTNGRTTTAKTSRKRPKMFVLCRYAYSSTNNYNVGGMHKLLRLSGPTVLCTIVHILRIKNLNLEKE